MPAGAQLAIVLVPWAACGMAAAHAKQHGRSAAVAFLAFAAWAGALAVLLAAGQLDGNLLFG